MILNAADRIALILGRAIMRAEALQVELDEIKARIIDMESAPKTGATD